MAKLERQSGQAGVKVLEKIRYVINVPERFERVRTQRMQVRRSSKMPFPACTQTELLFKLRRQPSRKWLARLIARVLPKQAVEHGSRQSTLGCRITQQHGQHATEVPLLPQMPHKR